MKTVFGLTSFIFSLFVVSSMNAADMIDLCDVPWTDAQVSWTATGRRYPVKNKNLMGNTICIAGVKYEKGLAGHAGFSVAYNLSGEALKLTAMIGIDDEGHPTDKQVDIPKSELEVIVYVDRREVYRKIVAWKEKAVPMSIDLKGASQIELRARGICGFRKQRIVFANPVFEVNNKEKFLKQAEGWCEKVEESRAFSPNYPDAPAWKSVKIEKITWEGWANAYRVDNGVYELIVLPEFGGRIMSFKKKGGENILMKNGEIPRDELPKRGMGRRLQHGGHIIRPQPHDYNSDPVLLFGKFEIDFPSEGEIVLRSAPSWFLWLSYRYRIKIGENSGSVEITNTHKNLAPFAREAGIWSITRMKSEPVTALMVPVEMKDPPAKMSFVPEELWSTVKVIDGWNVLPITPEILAELKPKESIQWQEFPYKNEIRVKLKNSTFIKKFDLSADDLKHMGRFWPAHFYIFKKFLESECHSPTRELKHNASISITETWSLK